MLFKLQKIPKKTILLPIVISLFVFSSLAQNNGSSPLSSDQEDIACKDIPKALAIYNQDIQLNQHSLKFALSGVHSFLKDVSNKKKIVYSELLKMIKDLEDVRRLAQDNELQLVSRSDNIQYFVEECLKEKE